MSLTNFILTHVLLNSLLLRDPRDLPNWLKWLICLSFVIICVLPSEIFSLPNNF